MDREKLQGNNIGVPAEFPAECSHLGNPRWHGTEQEHSLVNPRIIKQNKVLSFQATKFSSGLTCSNIARKKG